MANIPKPTNLNTIWASLGTKVDPGITKTNIGWVVQLPPYEYQNWAMNRQDTAIAHFNQHGIPEWDVNTEYQGNLSYAQGSNGFIYKCLQTHTGLDPTNTNNNLFWRLAFEEYGSVQVVQSALNAHLANYATLSGISNVVLARANLSVYSKAEGDSRYAFKGGDNATPFLVGTATNAQHAVPLSQINSLLVPATESSYGTTRYATISETETGTADDKAITPLKGATIYLKKSGNLTGLGNIATARTNLGLGTAATSNNEAFLWRGNNLGDLPNVPAARAALGLTSTATQPETYFLRVAQNLADLANVSTARNNLGLTALATTNPTAVLFKSDNLAGLASVPAARANLGLGTAAQQNSDAFLIRGNNLGDLTNVQGARNNLGLGNLSTRNVYGVGGDLDFSTVGGQTGWMVHPSGVLECWGVINVTGQREGFVGYPRGFTGAAWNIQITNVEQYPNEGNTIRVMDYSNPGGFSWSQNRPDFTQYFWRALGGV
jgi:hypothetical protein